MNAKIIFDEVLQEYILNPKEYDLRMKWRNYNRTNRIFDIKIRRFINTVEGCEPFCIDFGSFFLERLFFEFETIRRYDSGELSITNDWVKEKTELIYLFEYLHFFDPKLNYEEYSISPQLFLDNFIEKIKIFNQLKGKYFLRHLYYIMIDEGSYFKKNLNVDKNHQYKELLNSCRVVSFNKISTMYIYYFCNENSYFPEVMENVHSRRFYDLADFEIINKFGMKYNPKDLREKCEFKKYFLKEKYNIDWKTPFEEFPEINFE
ncbi:MAG TPA: hypothetical protein DDX39_10750 [Bacteroidales bacterium]|nr:MAG: hypothetical protein A2W98_13140 [Bacteroidetes bacterium GWF2_33_38]OFY72394.1 MAG: hypothetical protein A2265_07425 [Bacteroidetes bacterium RIFOXYA12_FULL_33_9]HBF89110.1 hypothetical protein [Bacteroidales bacterium]